VSVASPVLPVALALAAAALLVWSPADRPATARARALARPTVPDPPQPAAGPAASRLRRWPLAAAAGSAVAVLLGGLPGLVLGATAAVGLERALSRSGDAGARRLQAEVEDELPVACDLLAVCLTAGLPVGGALAAVAGTLSGPLAGELAVVAERYRLGSAARVAWDGVSGPVTGLGRVVARAGESGSAVVPALRALAADGRAAARSRTEARVRQAGVWVLAPLGACFLPAFVCLGVAPVVLGIAADVLP
jgi:pilus assembly protein TadC